MIDIHSSWPSIRRKSNAPTIPVDKMRSTVLDRIPGTESARRADTGPDNPARFLQVLVEAIGGKNLDQFFPIAAGVPKIIGVDGLQNPAGFDSFLEGFHAAMLFFNLPAQPVVRAEDDGVHRRLRAGAMGVRNSASVRKATPRPIRRFDEFLAMMPAGDGTLLSQLEAGTSDGIPLGFSEAISAFVGALRSAVFANDAGALLNLGQDFGALLVALHQVVNGGGESTERMIRVQKAPSDTARARVTAIEMDGVDYVIDPKTGKRIKKRRGK